MAVRSPPAGSSGTSFTGSIAATQVAFGSGVNAFTGSNNFTYTDSPPLLTVGSGTTTSAGVQMGYSGTSGISGIWQTGVIPAANNANFYMSGANTIVASAQSGGRVYFRPGGSSSTTSAITLGAGVFNPEGDGTVTIGASANRFSSAFLGDTGLSLGFTNTATVGAVTINKSSGRIIIAAGQQTVVLTNSLVTAASHMMLNIASATVDTTATSVQGDCSTPGQCTIRLNAPCTAQRTVDFVHFASN